MANYTRTLSRVDLTEGQAFSSSDLESLCELARKELRCWGEIQVIRFEHEPHVDLRFTCKRPPFLLFEQLDLDVSTITSFEGGFTRDELRTYSEAGEQQLGLARFAFDEVQIHTGKRRISPEKIGILGRNAQEFEYGYSVPVAGSYLAANFLYYGSETEFKVKVYDSGDPALALDRCNHGFICDTIFESRVPVIEKFLESVPWTWRDDLGWHPGSGAEKRFPNIERLELCYRGIVNQSFSYDDDLKQWRYNSHDDFQNLTNTSPGKPCVG